MIKVGIVGMGFMGWFHAAKHAQNPNAELVAIADILPERLKAQESVGGNIEGSEEPIDFSTVARYTNASELIARAGVDVVDVCLPTYLHACYTIEALEAGRHVFCEKPMALTVEDADRMIEAATKADRMLTIGQCIRFWPEFLFLRQCVREETFGKLLSLNMFRVTGRPAWSWENWFLDPARSGGPIYDMHIHDVDYVNSLLGLPDQVQATGRITEVTGSYDLVHALFNYDGGPQVHIHGAWTMAQIPFNHGFEACFERGYLRFDGSQDPTLLIFDDLAEVKGRPAEFEAGDGYYNELVYFLDCVATGQPPTRCPPESARDSLALVDKEVASIESGQPVSGKE